jgi:cytochrome c oxidase cbb3-type subunit 3
VAVITAVSALGLVWLVVSVYFGRGTQAGSAHEVWDETLTEGTTPAPLWWFWFIVALLAASVIYLILYPGMGSYAGALRWSQGGQIAASMARYDEQFGARRLELAAAPVSAIQQDEAAMRSASHVFNTHCTACHGADGRGQAALFADLRDESWQWGGDEAHIAQTITLGRQAVMPPWQPVLGDDGVARMADYVLALGTGTAVDDDTAMMFRNYCSACHGPDGGGNPALGAPALNDDVWLYGGTADAVRTSIAGGRGGIMPAFGERLDATEIKLLTAWLAAKAAPAADE